MITNTSIPILVGENPDKLAIRNKARIDITLTTTDISASNVQDTIALNFSENEVVTINDGASDTKGDTYFTPLYTEKINYDIWKTTINKSFQELEAL
jgi:hypothetical protein